VSKILIVDDDGDTLRLVTHRTAAAGHRVAGAHDASEALAIVDERGMPDVAVLDVGLPGMDGLELARSLRSRAGGDTLAVIFLSAYVEPEDISRGQEIGATYLTKPFVASALVNAIDRATKVTVTTW
jgi:DNA-binding response OmpR family regulator